MGLGEQQAAAFRDYGKATQRIYEGDSRSRQATTIGLANIKGGAVKDLGSRFEKYFDNREKKREQRKKALQKWALEVLKLGAMANKTDGGDAANALVNNLFAQADASKSEINEITGGKRNFFKAGGSPQAVERGRLKSSAQALGNRQTYGPPGVGGYGEYAATDGGARLRDVRQPDLLTGDPGEMAQQAGDIGGFVDTYGKTGYSEYQKSRIPKLTEEQKLDKAESHALKKQRESIVLNRTLDREDQEAERIRDEGKPPSVAQQKFDVSQAGQVPTRRRIQELKKLRWQIPGETEEGKKFQMELSREIERLESTLPGGEQEQNATSPLDAELLDIFNRGN